MSTTISEFVASQIESKAKDFVKSYQAVAEDKKSWKPLDKGRSALDQFLEVALLNGYVTDVILTQSWPEGGFDAYEAEKEKLLTADWDTLNTIFEKNLVRLLEAIRGVDASQFEVQIHYPWGAQSMLDTITYPLWNMSYHEGQINYIHYLNGGE
jgi:hypothetical protein